LYSIRPFPLGTQGDLGQRILAILGRRCNAEFSGKQPERVVRNIIERAMSRILAESAHFAAAPA